MPLFNSKVELNFKQTKHIVFAVTGADNADANSNNIIFTFKDTKYVCVITLSPKHNQKLTKVLSKGFERSQYWNEYKTIKQELRIKIQQMSIIFC